MTNRSLPPVLPSAPGDLVAVAVGGCQVILAWTECGAGGLGFRIERAAGNSPCSPFAGIGGVGPHVTAFRDGSVKSRTTNSYRVHAWNASGDSSPSNVVEVTTPRAETELPADQE
jgi:hypothetical protein